MSKTPRTLINSYLDASKTESVRSGRAGAPQRLVRTPEMRSPRNIKKTPDRYISLSASKSVPQHDRVSVLRGKRKSVSSPIDMVEVETPRQLLEGFLEGADTTAPLNRYGSRIPERLSVSQPILPSGRNSGSRKTLDKMMDLDLETPRTLLQQYVKNVQDVIETPHLRQHQQIQHSPDIPLVPDSFNTPSPFKASSRDSDGSNNINVRKTPRSTRKMGRFTMNMSKQGTSFADDSVIPPTNPDDYQVPSPFRATSSDDESVVLETQPSQRLKTYIRKANFSMSVPAKISEENVEVSRHRESRSKYRENVSNRQNVSHDGYDESDVDKLFESEHGDYIEHNDHDMLDSVRGDYVDGDSEMIASRLDNHENNVDNESYDNDRMDNEALEQSLSPSMAERSHMSPHHDYSRISRNSSMRNSPRRQTLSTSRHSPAPGRQSLATSTHSPVPGRQSLATSTHSPLPGRQSLATSTHSPVPGRQSLATSTHSPAPGRQSLATSTHSPLPGRQSLATSTHSPLPGMQSLATSTHSPAPSRHSSIGNMSGRRSNRSSLVAMETEMDFQENEEVYYAEKLASSRQGPQENLHTLRDITFSPKIVSTQINAPPASISDDMEYEDDVYTHDDVQRSVSVSPNVSRRERMSQYNTPRNISRRSTSPTLSHREMSRYSQRHSSRQSMSSSGSREKSQRSMRQSMNRTDIATPKSVNSSPGESPVRRVTPSSIMSRSQRSMGQSMTRTPQIVHSASGASPLGHVSPSPNVSQGQGSARRSTNRSGTVTPQMTSSPLGASPLQHVTPSPNVSPDVSTGERSSQYTQRRSSEHLTTSSSKKTESQGNISQSMNRSDNVSIQNTGTNISVRTSPAEHDEHIEMEQAGSHDTENITTKKQTPTSVKPKKKIIRKPRTKSNYTLPTNVVKKHFNHFAGMRVDQQAIETVMQISEKYWDILTRDLESYAKHAGRKRITMSDFTLLFKRQGYVSETKSLKSLIEKYLPMEEREKLIPVARAGNRIEPSL